MCLSRSWLLNASIHCCSKPSTVGVAAMAPLPCDEPQQCTSPASGQSLSRPTSSSGQTSRMMRTPSGPAKAGIEASSISAEPPAERLQRRAEAGQRRREIAAERGVDDDDDRDVVAGLQPHLDQRLAAAERHRVVVEDDRGRRVLAIA